MESKSWKKEYRKVKIDIFLTELRCVFFGLILPFAATATTLIFLAIKILSELKRAD